MKAVRKGGGRESVHEAIKENAVAVADALRNGDLGENDLSQRLADDERVPLDLQEIETVLNDPENFAAFSLEQAENFAAQVGKWAERFPEAKKLVPQALL
jgi:adenylosuccinate lyase